MTGLRQPHAQLRFLHQRLGMTQAFINARNRVIVYRAWLDKDSGTTVPSVSMPDLSAIDQV